MNKETSDKLLLKVAKMDSSVVLMAKMAAVNKRAVNYAVNPALTVVGQAAQQDTAAQNNAGRTPIQPTAAQTMNTAMNAAGVNRGYVKPSYLDVLKQRAGEAWDWTKGKWNELSPEARDSIGGIGLGVAGGLAGDAIARMLGAKKNRALRLLAMLGGVGLGVAGNRYLQNPEFKNTVNTGFSNLVNKING